jgi:3-oxoacyl-[acyl-carrier protein] reductase
MRLEDKVAIITGASQSIGKAVAIKFAQEGAKVVINYLHSKEEADVVAQGIRDAGGEAIAFRADVSLEEEVGLMVEETVKHFGGIDILVNNAAIDPRKVWHEISVKEWDAVMANNVRSQFICAKAVYPYMRKRKYGKIINVSSVTFFSGKSGYVHYVASKGAIIGFTRSLAREVGADNITVNCITPGAVLTETEIEKVGSLAAQEEVSKTLMQLQAIPRREVTDDIVGAFVFLASSDSDFTTGQTLNIDGGWMMH